MIRPVALLLILLASFATAYAQDSNAPGLVVVATGEARAPADMMILFVNVRAEAAEEAEASRRMAELANQAVPVFRKYVRDEQDIWTSNIYIGGIYRTQDENGRYITPVRIGSAAETTYSVRVRDFSRIPPLLAAISSR